jgi:hypothetical protein
MIAFILLKGKEFAIPDGVSTAVIGLFFGLVCGLFYYQRYHRNYYWVLSLAGGLMFTYLSHVLFLRQVSVDDASSLRMTLASFAFPFLMTLALNHALSLMKGHKHRKHAKQKTHSSFFDTADPGGILRAEGKK